MGHCQGLQGESELQAGIITRQVSLRKNTLHPQETLMILIFKSYCLLQKCHHVLLDAYDWDVLTINIKSRLLYQVMFSDKVMTLRKTRKVTKYPGL